MKNKAKDKIRSLALAVIILLAFVAFPLSAFADPAVFDTTKKPFVDIVDAAVANGGTANFTISQTAITNFASYTDADADAITINADPATGSPDFADLYDVTSRLEQGGVGIVYTLKAKNGTFNEQGKYNLPFSYTISFTSGSTTTLTATFAGTVAAASGAITGNNSDFTATNANTTSLSGATWNGNALKVPHGTSSVSLSIPLANVVSYTGTPNISLYNLAVSGAGAAIVGENISITITNPTSQTYEYTLTGDTANGANTLNKKIKIAVAVDPAPANTNLSDIKTGSSLDGSIPASVNKGQTFTVTFKPDNFIDGDGNEFAGTVTAANVNSYFNVTYNATYFNMSLAQSGSNVNAVFTAKESTSGSAYPVTVTPKFGASPTLSNNVRVVDPQKIIAANTGSSISGAVPSTLVPGGSFTLTFTSANFIWDDGYTSGKVLTQSEIENALDISATNLSKSWSGTTLTLTTTSAGTAGITISPKPGYGSGTLLSESITVVSTPPAPPPPTPPAPQPVPQLSDSGSGGGTDKPDSLPASLPSTLIVDASRATAALAAMRPSDTGVRIAHSGSIKTLAAVWVVFGQTPVNFDTIANGAVQVRVTVPAPGRMTTDMLLSGQISGPVADSHKALFEKWFQNKVQVIHLEQSGSWGQPVQIAARVDLTDMDSKNLVFYAYNKATNSYRRIENPAYRIDKNGYLHFTTEMAGDIIVSEGLLERR